jgi:hypothetical protein
MLPLVTSDTEKIATDEELEGHQSRSVLLPLLFQNDTGVHMMVSHGVSQGRLRTGGIHLKFKE